MTVQVIAPPTQAVAPIPTPLEKPGIRQAPEGINLDPMAVHTTGRLTAEIKRASQGLQETDEFVVEFKGWNGAEPRSSYISPKLLFGAPTVRTLNLEPKTVAFNLGRKVTVKYTAFRAGETPVPSGELELNVLNLEQKDLKAGVIFGKDDDGTGPVLDLTTGTEDRKAHTDIWPLIAIGQWFWIVLTGEDENGEPYELTLFEGQVDQALITLGYIEVLVLLSELKLLGDGTDAKLQYRVAFDQVKDKSKANLSEVRSYTVKNATLERPEITGMTDLNGVALHNGAVASTRGVKLTGTAGADQTVRMFLYRDEIDRIVADGDGKWEYEFERRDSHIARLGAKASDGSYSAIWLVWFAEEGTPIITGLTDSRGETVPAYGATFDSVLTSTGIAAPDEKVAIEFNPTHIIPVGSDGVWRHTLTRLYAGSNVFSVYARYGENLQSHTWVVYVVPVGTPVITSIEDSEGRDVPFEGSTFDQTIKLIGTARAGVDLAIFLGSTRCDFIKADPDGTWKYTLVLPPLPPTGYTFKVQALDGSGAQSPDVNIYPMAATEPNDAGGNLNSAQ